MHREKGSNFPFSTMGKGRHQREESHDPGGSTGGGRTKKKTSQGAWTKWSLPKRKITWTDLWKLELLCICFLLLSEYDTLPTPINLHKSGMRAYLQCKLCGEGRVAPWRVEKTALTQGRGGTMIRC